MMHGPAVLAQKMVSVKVKNSERAGRFKGKGEWLKPPAVVGTHWELCWARSSEKVVDLQAGEETELRVVAVSSPADAVGRCSVEPFMPSFPEFLFHSKIMVPSYAEFRLTVWRDGVDTPATCVLGVQVIGENVIPTLTQ
jgi:hypothetical protein